MANHKAAKINIPEHQDIHKEHQEDYVFRFKIETGKKIPDPDTLLIEFYHEQIIDLLKIVFFSRDGKKLIPNEFGFLNEPGKKFPLTFKE